MDENKRLELFNNHTKLAYSVARNHWGYSVDNQDDMTQEALLALWSATATYKEDLAAFSSYAYTYIYHSLTTYVKTYKYGKMSLNSKFQLACRYVRKAKNENTPLDSVLDSEKASKSTREYARLIYMGDEAFLSLSEPVHDEDALTIGDITASSYNMEEDILSKLSDKQVLEMFDEEFAPTCFRFVKSQTDTHKKLLTYYREHIFGKDIPQAVIAEKVGISRSAVSAQFQRWDRYLKKFLEEKSDVLTLACK